jgi:hypothetical protein
MTGWNEDNFLEKLMAQARQQGGAQRDSCPDAETLCAVLEGEAPAPIGDQVREHLRHCPGCAELQSRLLNFDAGTSPEPEAVWNQTRKRLDNWLEGFLRSEAANLGGAKSTAPWHKGVRWETFWRPLISWKVAWGLAAVALLVFIAEGVVVMELRRARPSEVQVAARGTVPQEQAANAQATESRVEKGGPGKGINKPLKAPHQSGLPQVERHPAVGAPLVGALTEPEHGLPQVAGRPPIKQRAQHGEKANAPGGQVAEPLPSSPPLNAAAAPAPASPPSIRLEPGVHLLIALGTVKQLPDGTFQFRGTLSLPVPQTGPVSLARGAEVIGAGAMSQGQTSLTVTEFVVGGSRYTLKSGSGAMKAQALGAEGPVQFVRTQVLEMSPSSPAVYEKAPDTTPQT